MDNQKFIEKCKELVVAEVNDHAEEMVITTDDVFVSWSAKVLQNNKALLSYPTKGAPYFEITHNGDKGEIYIDKYVKVSNNMDLVR